jgi:hypothetical protein
MQLDAPPVVLEPHDPSQRCYRPRDEGRLVRHALPAVQEGVEDQGGVREPVAAQWWHQARRSDAVTSPEDVRPDYVTRLDGSLAIMREIDRITFEERALKWFEGCAPAVVAELKKRGVKFPEETA